MLRTLCRLDKLAAAHRAFTELGMMDGTAASYTAFVNAGGEPQPRMKTDGDEDKDEDNGPAAGPKVLSDVKLCHFPGALVNTQLFSLNLITLSTARGYPNSIEALAVHIKQPQFPDVLRRFLYSQVNPDTELLPDDIPLEQCPDFMGRISVYHSAVARFFAPSDQCGTGGMHRETIRSNPNWREGYTRHDTVFVEVAAGVEQHGMQGMVIARVRLFFSFTLNAKHYPCALVEWFIPGDEPDEDTGMWIVRPEFYGNGQRTLDVVHVDCIARAAHLIPVFGTSFVPDKLHFSDSLDVYHAYFVNNYIDHHCNEFLS
jgi:hypothetical protein